MSSTGQELLELLEFQINVGTTSANTDPTQALLVRYLNIAQRKMALQLKPAILRNTNGVSIATTSGQTTVTIPTSSILVVENVFHKETSSYYKELARKKLPNVIDPNFYFSSNNSECPGFYEVRGGTISVDAPFPTTASDGLKVFGIQPPTNININSLSTNIDTPEEYDMLLVYKAAGFFYQRDDDTKNYNIQKQLELREISELQSILSDDFPSSITLSNRFFKYGDR